MSASKEKKKRLEEKASGVEKVDVRAEKEKNEKKKIRTFAIAVAAVVVVLLVLALFINSKFVRRSIPAVTINDVDFTVTDCNYYYYQCYYDYYNTIYTSLADYANEMLPSNDKPLASQIYDEETGKTWAEFFDEMALEAMESDALIYSEAKKAGFEMTEKSKAELEEEITLMKDTATNSATFKNFEQYLQAYYGNAMNESALRRVAEIKYVVSDYSAYKQDSFEYTEDEIEANYSENAHLFDIFTYRYFLVYADKVEESDFDGDEDAYNAAKDEAMAKAKEQAEGYLARIKSEADFIEIAREYDAETYAEDDSTLRNYKGELLGSIYGEWLREDSRVIGDTTTAETTTGHYVVYYGGRDNNHYTSVNARVITVAPETINSDDYAEDEDTTAYDNAVAAAFQDALTKAKGFYDSWVAEGAGEEKFIELFNTNSSDLSAEDGLYENIARGQFVVKDLDSWLYDPARQPGDYTLIEGDVNIYVAYFVGEGEQYSTYLSREDMQKDDYAAWVESLGEGTISKKWTYALAE
ncbi:MAG: hypothetical protein HUJ65_05520 [Oscillospiraceae bacterium]|nr:hypothetical protein [Oscillospiraceae bacterium]